MAIFRGALNPHHTQAARRKARPSGPFLLPLKFQGGGGARTARRFLPLPPALLVACLAAGAFEARATDLRVDSAVIQTNNGVILDGDGKIEITSRGSITVNASSPALPAPLDLERNTGILLRGAGSSFGSPSSNNTITNNGEISVSGSFSEGVNVVDIAAGTRPC